MAGAFLSGAVCLSLWLLPSTAGFPLLRSSAAIKRQHMMSTISRLLNRNLAIHLHLPEVVDPLLPRLVLLRTVEVFLSCADWGTLLPRPFNLPNCRATVFPSLALDVEHGMLSSPPDAGEEVCPPLANCSNRNASSSSCLICRPAELRWFLGQLMQNKKHAQQNKPVLHPLPPLLTWTCILRSRLEMQGRRRAALRHRFWAGRLHVRCKSRACSPGSAALSRTTILASPQPASIA